MYISEQALASYKYINALAAKYLIRNYFFTKFYHNNLKLAHLPLLVLCDLLIPKKFIINQ